MFSLNVAARISHLFAVCLVTGFVCTSAFAGEVVDLFFLAGQSNASGRVNTGFTADTRDSQVRYYYDTDYYTSGPDGLAVATSGGAFTALGPVVNGYYGSEISMGRRLVDLGYNPGIVKVSRGGTDLAVKWNSFNTHDGFGEVWQQWTADAAEAISAIEAEGNTVRLRGFFWMQGENDTSDAHIANTSYHDLYATFVSDVTEHLSGLGHDASEMIFVTAQIRDFIPPNSGVVRTAQKDVMVELGDRGVYFDTNDLNTLGEGDLHYNVQGVTTLGERFADGFHDRFVSIPEPASIAFMVSVLPLVLLARSSRKNEKGVN